MAYDSTKPNPVSRISVMAADTRENFRAVIAGEVPFTNPVADGSVRITGTTPYVMITDAGWAASTYLQAGVTPNGGGAGSYTAFLNPAGKGFSWAAGGSAVATLTHLGSLALNGSINAAATIYADSVGSNIRIKSDGTGANDFGFFMTNAGVARIANWNVTRGLQFNADGGIQQIGTSNVLFSGSTLVDVTNTSAALSVTQRSASGYGLKVRPGHDGLYALWINSSNDSLTRHWFNGSGDVLLSNGGGSTAIGSGNLYVGTLNGSNDTALIKKSLSDYSLKIFMGNHDTDAVSTFQLLTHPGATLPVLRADVNGNASFEVGWLGVGMNQSSYGPTTPGARFHVYDPSAVVGAATARLEGWFGGYGSGIEMGSRLSGSYAYKAMAKIVADGNNSWSSADVSSQDARLGFFVCNDGVLGEAVRINPDKGVDFYGVIKSNSSFAAYTADGIFGASALPSRILTPGDQTGKRRQIAFGYADGGSSQYAPRMGFIVDGDANQTDTKASLGIEPTNGDFTIRGGNANTEHLRLKNGTGAVHERGRAAAMGDWTTFTPTLTVQTGAITTGTVDTARYMLIGKTMTVVFHMRNGSINAAPTWISLAIPGGFTSSTITTLPTWFRDGTGFRVGASYVSPSNNVINFYPSDPFSNIAWTAGTLDIHCVFIFEVQ